MPPIYWRSACHASTITRASQPPWTKKITLDKMIISGMIYTGIPPHRRQDYYPPGSQLSHGVHFRTHLDAGQTGRNRFKLKQIVIIMKPKQPLIKTPSAFGLYFTLIISSAQAADGWTLLPGADDNYKAEPALSVMIGSLNPNIPGTSSDSVVGFELSLNCPLLQPPGNKIRQQISLGTYSHKGMEITTLELNPHYVIRMPSGLGVGFGPGIGYVQAETATDKENMFALQIGASLHYTAMDFMFLGAEVRYQLTQDHTFPTLPQQDANNFRVALKAGVNF